MKKKIIAIAVAVVLVITGVVSGTIAYLSDTDSDVNVITLGNVSIKQIELQRDENGGLEPFVQGQRLLPGYENAAWEKYVWGDAVTADGAWNDLFGCKYGVMDKFVFVENTGKTEAYFRTIIAIESPEGLTDGTVHINRTSYTGFDWGQESDDFEWIEGVMIDGVRYDLCVATYTEALQPGEISRPSFLQVGLDKAATNKDMELIGETLEVLVFTQAVQAYGFEAVEGKSAAQVGLEEAFGVVTADAHPWADVDLNVSLGNDDNPAMGSSTTNVVGMQTEGGAVDHVTILDNTTDKADGGKYFRALYGSGIGQDLTVTNSYLQGTYAMNVTASGVGLEFSAENTTFDGWVSYSGFDSATFEDCTFIGEYTHSDYAESLGYSLCRVQTYDNTSFKNCEFGENFVLSKAGTDDVTVTIENCYKDGVLVTAENFNELLNSAELCGDYQMTTATTITILVDGVEVVLPEA